MSQMIFGRVLLVLLFFYLIYDQDLDTLIARYAQVYSLVDEG